MGIIGRLMLNKLSSSLWVVPYLISAGAVVLFVVAYISHTLLGDENIIEETAEDFLRKEYKIQVEFSGVRND